MSGVLTQANLGRVDQGVDFTGEGVVSALGDGEVTRVSTRSGWPGGGLVVYKLTSGPAKGHYIYVAENLVPHVREGQKLKAGDTVAVARGSYPYIETGWANARGLPIAPLNPSNKGAPTSAGQSFLNFLKGSGALSTKGGTGDFVPFSGTPTHKLHGGADAQSGGVAGSLATGPSKAVAEAIGYIFDQLGKSGAAIVLTIVLVVAGAALFGFGVTRVAGAKQQEAPA